MPLKWTTFLIKLSLFRYQNIKHFFWQEFPHYIIDFPLLKLSIWNLTFSCWLGLSINYSLVLSSTGRAEVFEPRSLGFYNPISFFFLCYQKSVLLHQGVPAALWETTSAMTVRPCVMWHCFFYGIKCLDFVTVIAAWRLFPSLGHWTTKTDEP